MKQLLALLLIANTAFAQNIYDAHHYKRGVYKSFKEFRENNPSDTANFVVKGKTNAAQFYLLSPGNELYTVDSTGKESKIKKFWGFTDGSNIYIKDAGLQKIEEIGYYCIYQIHALSTNIPNRTTDGMVFPNTPPALVDKKVINLATGEYYYLTLYNMKKYILPQDTALMREFYKDPQNKEKLVYYIQKFNKRNTPSW